MSSRRSARLSSTSSIAKDVPKRENGTPPPKATAARKKRKIADEAVDLPVNGQDAPSTPKRKRTAKPIPPVTPTPSAIRLMSSPVNGHIFDMLPPTRLAIPNGTNAPLLTPETHRLIANKTLDQVSPSKMPNIKTTTGNLLDEATAHLIKMEPKLKPIIEAHPCRVFSPEGLAEEIDPFKSLVSGILSQQVSGAAAKSIQAKFVALFNPEKKDKATHVFPTPSQVITKSIEELRPAGLSQRKAEYVHGLAEKFHKGELTTAMLSTASYDQVLAELIKVRGLGKWSIEMFACFGLKRMDVFSTGDLGVQRGMATLAGRDVAKLKGRGGKWKYMSEKDMEETAEKFRPYRSLFMWYTWRVEDVDVSAMEN